MSASSRVVGALLLVWSAATLSSPGLAQAPSTTKRVVVLYWYARDYPATLELENAFAPAVRAAAPWPVDVYSEYLETNKFPGDDQIQALHDYLQRKYAGRKIDAVVASSHPSLSFFLRYRETLFADAPIVFHAISSPSPDEARLGAGATGFVYMQSHKNTLDLALKLHPETEQVFVISGTTAQDTPDRLPLLLRRRLR